MRSGGMRPAVRDVHRELSLPMALDRSWAQAEQSGATRTSLIERLLDDPRPCCFNLLYFVRADILAADDPRLPNRLWLAGAVGPLREDPGIERETKLGVEDERLGWECVSLGRDELDCNQPEYTGPRIDLCRGHL